MRHRLGVKPQAVSEHKGKLVPVLTLQLGMAVVLIGVSVSASAFQTPSPHTKQGSTSSRAAKPQAAKAEEPDLSGLQEALKNPDLMAELGRLVTKIQNGIQYPAVRNSSRILPLLPESTVFYLALPNYGETMHQALQIFRQELQESAQLKDFLQKNKLDAAEPKLENTLDKFYEFSQDRKSVV